MNILDRYFLKEFLKPFAACIFAFLLCMLVYDLYDNIGDFVEAKTPFSNILYRYFILTPAWLVDIMPITLLLSLLYVLSDMSKNGELTAMRASGLNFSRLMAMYFFIGACISMQMLSLNLAWAPIALYKAKVAFEKTIGTHKIEIQSEKISDHYYRDIPGNRFWYIGALDLQRQRGTTIEISQSDENQKPIKQISAASGFYDQGYWTLYDVTIYDYTLPALAANKIQKFPLLIDQQLVEPPQQMIIKSEKTKRISTRELLQSLRYSSRLPKKQYAMLSTEFHSRIAFPIANLVVFLIGVPFGVFSQRQSNFFAIINALIFFAAYILMREILLIFAQSSQLAPWIAAWLPNILFALIGMIMIRKLR